MGTTFMGMNEHHGTRWQQTDRPMVVITREDIYITVAEIESVIQ